MIRLQLDKINQTHRQVFEGLREQGIGVNLHYIPVHTQPYYQNMGFKKNDFPKAERYYSEAISLPMYQGLTDEQQDEVRPAKRARGDLGQCVEGCQPDVQEPSHTEYHTLAPCCNLVLGHELIIPGFVASSKHVKREAVMRET